MKIDKAKELIINELQDTSSDTWFSIKVQRKALHWGLRKLIPQKHGKMFDNALNSLEQDGEIIITKTNRETWVSLSRETI
jgi:hypothetical protein